MEPLQLIVAARRFVEAAGCDVRGLAASWLALVRDVVEPTRSAWSLLLDRLGVEGSIPSPLVAAASAGSYAAAPERGFDTPLLVLRVPIRESLAKERAETTRFYDRDQVIVGR